jgi:uncharacterized protein (TIGR04255 family)
MPAHLNVQAMTEPQRLPKAPIVEAVLDISAALPEMVDLSSLATFQDRLGRQYPTKQVRHAWSGRIELKGHGPPETKSSGGPIGYLFTSGDGKQVVQARRDGFSFSRLRPYEDWSAFGTEARRLWTAYRAQFKPSKVTRFALRFINRIELPMPFADFKEYLLTVPEIAPGLPQSLQAYFFRLEIPDPDSQAVAIITQTIEPAEGPKGALPVIFDIDVVRQGQFPTDPEKLWPMFEQLREFKDRIFFRSLTDKALELFK